MYQCTSIHESASDAKIGILLSNLGTPDAPTKKAVKPYLRQFLSDTRVIEPPPPRWIWKIILNGVILNLRPRKISEGLSKLFGIRMEKGSPLLSIAKKQKNAIATELEKLAPGKFCCVFRYELWKSINGLCIKTSLRLRDVIILSSYLYILNMLGHQLVSVFDAAARELMNWRNVPDLRFISSYSKEDLYIEALANSVKEYQTVHGKPDLLLMSYHGIPKRYFDKGDNYPCQCCKNYVSFWPLS